MPNNHKLGNSTHANYRKRVWHYNYSHECSTNYKNAKIIFGRNKIGNNYKNCCHLPQLELIWTWTKCRREPQSFLKLGWTNYYVSPTFIKPFVTIHAIYSHVGGTIPTSFMLVRLVVMETHGTEPTRMITKGLIIMTFVSTMLPLDPRGEPLVLQGGFGRITRISILPTI